MNVFALLTSFAVVFAAVAPVTPGQTAAGTGPTASGGAHDLVLFLANGESKRGDEALLDAVSIYTRDLRVRLQSIAFKEASPTHGIKARDSVLSVLRVHRARIAFWYELAGAPQSLDLFVLDSQTGTLRVDRVAVDAPGKAGAAPDGATEDLRRAVALKLRAILADMAPPPATRADAPATIPAPKTERTNASAPEPVRSALPAQPTPTPTRTDSPKEAVVATIAPQAAESTRTPTPSPRAWTGAFLMAAFDLSTAFGTGQLRDGVLLQGVLAFDSPWEIGVTIEHALKTQSTVSTGALALTDDVARASGRFVLRERGYMAGVGAFLDGHMLSASARSTDATESVRAFAAGIGIEALFRLAAPLRTAWECRVWAAGLAPRTRFYVAGQPAVETAPMAFGIGLGLAFPTR